ncbi:zinc-dependent peptidase [Legionella yabuuchiae]|uniref:M90 family metallopeptidase n=1 Tax=Legionella yabuuchiae TaxID=376727 RepID=UPI001054BA9B|nr:M90 family metallopeptidase [Legionella yabuuchiae]
MFHWLKQWYHDRIIRRSTITSHQWEEAFQSLPLLSRLNFNERQQLRNLAILFLHYKSLEGVGIQVTTSMQLIIALQACLPILKLGLEWYEGWVSVVIYPGAFAKEEVQVDEGGVVHQGKISLSGESWQRGPVVLSWQDLRSQSSFETRNVVIHELAHKLDMLNGQANGLPPLHKEMSIKQWAEVFTLAYEDFCQRLLSNTVPMDSYAATSPGEFFAVLSEYFFENPKVISEYYPNVYEQLVEFYRQDPNQ